MSYKVQAADPGHLPRLERCPEVDGGVVAEPGAGQPEPVGVSVFAGQDLVGPGVCFEGVLVLVEPGQRVVVVLLLIATGGRVIYTRLIIIFKEKQ